MRAARLLIVALVACAGCYHYTFVEGTPPGLQTRTYKVRRTTFLNGFVGNGRVDTRQFCDDPVKAELRVTPADVAIGMATLLIVTPHTLYVTCPIESTTAPQQTSAGRQIYRF